MPLVFLQIRYLLKCFKPLNLLVQSTTFSFGNLFYIQYKTKVKKKNERPSGRLKLTSMRPKLSRAKDCGGLKLMSKIRQNVDITITCILIFIDSTQVFGIVSVQCYGCNPWAAGNILSGPSLEKIAHPWTTTKAKASPSFISLMSWYEKWDKSA